MAEKQTRKEWLKEVMKRGTTIISNERAKEMLSIAFQIFCPKD